MTVKAFFSLLPFAAVIKSLWQPRNVTGVRKKFNFEIVHGAMKILQIHTCELAASLTWMSDIDSLPRKSSPLPRSQSQTSKSKAGASSSSSESWGRRSSERSFHSGLRVFFFVSERRSNELPCLIEKQTC